MEIIIVYVLRIIIAVFGFSILVFFHELGHFLIAIFFKIKVEKFSIGMGPAIWGFKKGGTFFQIGSIPFGGFCQFKGDELKDDLPVEINYENFNNIFNKIQDKESKDFILKYYQIVLPAEFDSINYKNILKKLKDNETKLVENSYKFDDIDDKYKLIDISEDEKSQLIEIFKKTNYILKYKLSNNPDLIVKKSLFKIISQVTKIYELREPNTFFGSKPYKRLLIAFFGPFMNYALAIICFTLLALGTRKELDLPPKIMIVDDLKFNDYKYVNEESQAKKGGLMTGDIITAIDDVKINDFLQISEIIFNTGKEVKIEIKRGDERLFKYVTPKWNAEAMRYTIGILSYVNPVILGKEDVKLHEILDLQEGDIIIGIDDYKTDITVDFIDEYFKYYFGKAKKSILYLKRGDKIIEKEVAFNELNHILSDNEMYFSFHYPYKIIKETNIVKAFTSSFETSIKVIKVTGIFLYSLVFRPKKNVQKHFGGPIKIGVMISEATLSGFKEGFIEGLKVFLNFVSIISLALAIFNLLPIPALDGGHIVLSLVEIIIRRSISLKILYIINMIFFILLMTLGIFVAYLDIFQN
ncbi:MAG: site-2 protease family protein [Spirochaetes bacterium]|nr:site-2 protease family protein [Spirochaetota bacterium]